MLVQHRQLEPSGYWALWRVKRSMRVCVQFYDTRTRSIDASGAQAFDSMLPRSPTYPRGGIGRNEARQLLNEQPITRSSLWVGGSKRSDRSTGAGSNFTNYESVTLPSCHPGLLFGCGRAHAKHSRRCGCKCVCVCVCVYETLFRQRSFVQLNFLPPCEEQRMTSLKWAARALPTR